MTSTFSQINLVAIQWIGFSVNTIVSSDITSQGWQPINSPPTGTLVYWKVLPEIDTPSSGVVGSTTSQFTVNSSPMAGGSTVEVRVWAADLQNQSDMPFGVTDNVGSIDHFGASTGIGLGAEGEYGKGYPGSQNSATINLVITTF